MRSSPRTPTSPQSTLTSLKLTTHIPQCMVHPLVPIRSTLAPTACMFGSGASLPSRSKRPSSKELDSLLRRSQVLVLVVMQLFSATNVPPSSTSICGGHHNNDLYSGEGIFGKNRQLSITDAWPTQWCAQPPSQRRRRGTYLIKGVLRPHAHPWCTTQLASILTHRKTSCFSKSPRPKETGPSRWPPYGSL
jgi:hypothetical protein